MLSVDFEINVFFVGIFLINFVEVGSVFNILGIDDQDFILGNGSMGSNEDDYDGVIIFVL